MSPLDSQPLCSGYSGSDESRTSSACGSSSSVSLLDRLRAPAPSALAERVFSLLKNAFGEQQQSSLHDLVAATLMVQYNRR